MHEDCWKLFIDLIKNSPKLTHLDLCNNYLEKLTNQTQMKIGYPVEKYEDLEKREDWLLKQFCMPSLPIVV